MGSYSGAKAKQTHPFKEATEQVPAASASLLLELLKLASLINRPMLDHVATPNGVSANELRVLMCLSGEGPLPGFAIAHLLGMPPMNVSRAIAALLDRRWLEYAPERENRRLKPVQLSKLGWVAHRKITDSIDSLADDLLQELTAGEREKFVKTAEKIIAGIERRASD